MDVNAVNSGSIPSKPIKYTFTRTKQKMGEVNEKHFEEAADIDKNKDYHLSDTEIKDYLSKKDILRDPSIAQVDERKILNEYKLTLENKPLPQAVAYHSYESMTEEMKDMAEKFPNLCDMVSLGKTVEGRDIWALKISKKPEAPPEEEAKEGGQAPPQEPKPEPKKKPGMVITGLHHAREWITLEVPLFAAKSMLENYDSDPKMKNRVDNAETYIVPLVNPDGYEYSREVNSWWRKNREPITQTACDIEQGANLSNLPGGIGTSTRSDEAIQGYGVDLNRNYYDGTPEHMYLYRPDGDTPCSTWDDEGASDRISSDTYRGPKGASTKEVSTMQNLMMENKNIKAAIDFHSYGRMILYPWGHGYEEADNAKEYEKIAGDMANIIKNSDDEHVSYRPMQSSNLYPATGSSEDFEHGLGMLGITIELGRSFAPRESEIDPTRRRLLGAEMYLLDYVIENADSIRPQTPPQQPA